MTEMTKYKIIRLTDRPELKEKMATWFHEKWGIPLDAYLESMNVTLEQKASVPCWYVVFDGDRIIGGAGVIENDFHDRPDLTPNLCALYVEEDRRREGIAGTLLSFICEDMKQKGINTLYLVTDHTSFYERYGWDYFCYNVPLFGPIVSRSAISKFSRTLGTLMGSGVPVLQSLNIVKETAGNQLISDAIQKVHDAVKEGETMAAPLDATKVFPAMVISMIEVGEETGRLPEMLETVANTYDEEVDNAVGALTSMIEPLMIVGLAVIVGGIVIALFAPLVSIIENLGG